MVFSIALAPKFPIPNRSAWENNEADKLGVDDLTVEDWDACRKAIFRAIDLFQPGSFLNSEPLDKYIYENGRLSHDHDWKEAWHSQAGRHLDDLSLHSMRKVFRYMNLAVKARQKIVLNVQLAHALFILQLFNTAAQSLQHAYRSNRLFWHQVNAYSFSDAVVLAAYPTKLFMTIVMYSRVVISASAVNSFFREVSLLAHKGTGLAAEVAVLCYFAVTPPDLVSVVLFTSFHHVFDRIYRRCCGPMTQWKGICFAMLSASTLLFVPLLVHSSTRWMFGESSNASTIMLRLCDMERILLWDVQGYDVSDFAFHLLSSLDQNVAGLLVASFVGALILGVVAKYSGHSLGGGTALLGIRPGTMLKVWVLQPEYYSTGFHYNERSQRVAPILGASWWWHTVGLFNPKYEAHYQRFEKTFYLRYRLMRHFGLTIVWSSDATRLGLRGILPPLRSLRQSELTDGLRCHRCQGKLWDEHLQDSSMFLQFIHCRLCLASLCLQSAFAETVAWYCTNKSCMDRLICCQRCAHQVRTGDAAWTYEALRAIEATPCATVEMPNLANNPLQPEPFETPPEQVSANPAKLVDVVSLPCHSPGDPPPQGSDQAQRGEVPDSTRQPQSPKRRKLKPRRRISKDEPAAITVDIQNPA